MRCRSVRAHTDLAEVMRELLFIFNYMSKASLESEVHSKVGQSLRNLRGNIQTINNRRRAVKEIGQVETVDALILIKLQGLIDGWVGGNFHINNREENSCSHFYPMQRSVLYTFIRQKEIGQRNTRTGTRERGREREQERTTEMKI